MPPRTVRVTSSRMVLSVQPHTRRDPQAPVDEQGTDRAIRANPEELIGCAHTVNGIN